MKIEITATAQFFTTIEIDKEIGERIKNNYGGDIDKWIRRNYADYIDFSDPDDTELEEASYDENEAKEILKGLSPQEDKNLCEAKMQEDLMWLKIDTPYGELNSLNLEADKLKKVLPFVDRNNPCYKELNFIHLRGYILEATDTKQLIRIKHIDIGKELFIPPCFVAPLQNLDYGGNWYKQNFCGFKFPDTDRVLKKLKAASRVEIKDLKFKKDTSYRLKFSKMFFNGIDTYINERYYENILQAGAKYALVPQRNDSLMFFTGENVNMVVMLIGEGEIK